jgi:VWA domain-containing protein
MSVRAKSCVNPGVLFLTVLVVVVWPGGVARVETETPQAAAPAQRPQFRAGADVVPVYATVRDPDRGFVLDLTPDDFELYDDGRKQTITQFTIAAQPLSAIVLIDGSGSMIPEFNRAIEGARNFVLRMLAEDRAKIGSFADRVVLGPRFTSDRDALLAYLDDQFNLRVGGETHLWEAIVESSLALGNESGKRVVVVLSDGYNFVLPPGYAPQSPGSSGGYPPVGGRGPASPPTGGGRIPGGLPVPIGPPPGGAPPGGAPPGSAPRPGPGGVRPQPPQPTPSNMGNFDPTTYGVTMEQVEAASSARNVIVFGLSMWVRQSQGADRPSRDLERLAVDTGGAFYQVGVNDDLNPVFTDVVQQLRQQYVLGFVPAAFDGKRHSLTVRVKRPGLQVQARKSYIATREK